MSRLVVGPFNRVEGDLEVVLDVADGRVRDARVGASLYRGFETLLEGRPATDALAVAPRVCGICSLSHSVAAARALADLAGLAPAPNGEKVLNLAQAAEVVADHLTHFHLFFMPDFARPAYADRPWAERAAVFQAGRGGAQAPFLAARARFMHLMGGLMGKWPHSLAVQPGGVTRAVQAGEKAPLVSILREFRAFLEDAVFGGRPEDFAALDSEARLAAWKGGAAGLFLDIARDMDLWSLGAWQGILLAAPSYPDCGKPLFTSGMWEHGDILPLDAGSIAEDSTHAWLEDSARPLPPREGVTRPDADKPQGYTWAKAPRLGGRAAEVGALARQV
ncbi:MAG: nickel-dependent hydrogenase large subunit, partial [Magnetospirillum sp. WYHS-4]